MAYKKVNRLIHGFDNVTELLVHSMDIDIQLTDLQKLFKQPEDELMYDSYDIDLEMQKQLSTEFGIVFPEGNFLWFLEAEESDT